MSARLSVNAAEEAAGLSDGANLELAPMLNGGMTHKMIYTK